MHTASRLGINMPRCAPWELTEPSLTAQRARTGLEGSAAGTTGFTSALPVNSTSSGLIHLVRVTKRPRSSRDACRSPEDPQALKTKHVLENQQLRFFTPASPVFPASKPPGCQAGVWGQTFPQDGLGAPESIREWAGRQLSREVPFCHTPLPTPKTETSPCHPHSQQELKVGAATQEKAHPRFWQGWDLGRWPLLFGTDKPTVRTFTPPSSRLWILTKKT